MALFKYIGSYAKENGKVDVNVGRYSFLNITPNNFEIEVPDDSTEATWLNVAIDPFEQSYLYEQQV